MVQKVAMLAGDLLLVVFVTVKSVHIVPVYWYAASAILLVYEKIPELPWRGDATWQPQSDTNDGNWRRSFHV
jgi:hypothetical protein